MFKAKSEAHDASIFGERGSQLPNSTTHSMSAAANGWTLTPQPRLVHGGSFRNHSEVALDRNLTAGMPSYRQDYGTTHQQTLWSGAYPAPLPTHRFDLPHKNLSTHLSTTMANADDGALVNGRTHAVGGCAHYTSTSASHFAPTAGVKLVVPPGKGGVDMSRSDVPLGSSFGDGAPTAGTHSHDAYTGQQLHELRHTCASRGTLGVRGGRKLPRGSSGGGFPFG